MKKVRATVQPLRLSTIPPKNPPRTSLCTGYCASAGGDTKLALGAIVGRRGGVNGSSNSLSSCTIEV